MRFPGESKQSAGFLKVGHIWPYPSGYTCTDINVICLDMVHQIIVCVCIRLIQATRNVVAIVRRNASWPSAFDHLPAGSRAYPVKVVSLTQGTIQ